MGSPGTQIYTLTQALNAGAKYCAYKERCHQDVRLFLKKRNCPDEIVEEALAELISQGFLNEQRFTQAFVLGKLRQNGWGKVKIAHQLRSKNVSNTSVEDGLSQIEFAEYLEVLNEIAQKKLKELLRKKSDRYDIKAALMRFLVSRGFETELVKETAESKLKEIDDQ